MSGRDLEFKLKLGRIGQGRSSLSAVRAAVRRASNVAPGNKSRMAPKVGQRAPARMSQAGSRRVVVKAQSAMHEASMRARLRAHVTYLARQEKRQARGEPGLERSLDDLQREEAPSNAGFSFYDERETGVDARAVTADWSKDTRHYRLIVSAEDGEALGDLKPMIRELMTHLERKLGTRFEWIAVDHWDTDNPHTHVLLRGKGADGEDLFISSKILRHGIREHAEEMVTRVLGPKADVDLARERRQEISEMGPTPRDHQLAASRDEAGRIFVLRPDLNARLEQLERWGLAERGRQGWRVEDGFLGSLQAMARHAEVERAVSNRPDGGHPLPVLSAEPGQSVEGRLVHLSPTLEFAEGFLAVIETGRGELRYQRFEREDDVAHLRGATPGAIITFEANVPEVRASDKAIAEVAEAAGGLYSIGHHLEASPGTSQGLIDANLRRLEAMRAMSLVALTEEGVFVVGEDHLKRAMLYEERIAQRFPVSARVLSYWTLEEQIEAKGLTHLDRVLAGEAAAPTGTGDYTRKVSSALENRRLHLIEQGWMRAEEALLSPSAMAQMAGRELRGLAQDISDELGKPVHIDAVSSVHGVYARRIDLAQGRVALIVGAHEAHLVPWRPPLERFTGQMTSVLRGQGWSWDVARGMGLGLG